MPNLEQLTTNPYVFLIVALLTLVSAILPIFNALRWFFRALSDLYFNGFQVFIYRMKKNLFREAIVCIRFKDITQNVRMRIIYHTLKNGFLIIILIQIISLFVGVGVNGWLAVLSAGALSVGLMISVMGFVWQLIRWRIIFSVTIMYGRRMVQRGRREQMYRSVF